MGSRWFMEEIQEYINKQNNKEKEYWMITYEVTGGIKFMSPWVGTIVEWLKIAVQKGDWILINTVRITEEDYIYFFNLFENNLLKE